jgi:hypothetical protein
VQRKKDYFFQLRDPGLRQTEEGLILQGKQALLSM